LGIGGAVPSGSIVLDVSGDSRFSGKTTTIGNNFVGGNIAVGKLSAANAALDVSGSAIISSNLTVSLNTFTNSLGVGKTIITNNVSVDISGNTRIAGNLAVSSNLDISNNSTIRGGLIIQGQGTLTSNYALNVIGNGNVNYTQLLTGNRATLSGNLRALRIGVNKDPTAALDVAGSGAFSQNIQVLGQVSTSNFLATGAVATPNLSIGQGGIPPFYYPFQLVGNSKITGRINLNIQGINPPAYEFDMSGVLNTTKLVSSNIYVTNIYGPTTNPYAAPNSSNNIMMYGPIINDTSIQVPTIGINRTTSNNYALCVSGDVLVSGSITSSPPPVEYVQYLPTGNQGGGGGGQPGWDLPAGTSTVYLRLPNFSTTYIIDGSGGGAQSNLSVIIAQQPDVATDVSGITFIFIARNTTGAGHQLIYPYSNGSNPNIAPYYPTYSRAFQAPLNISLLGVGLSDYSST
jgi:hypothetical protein